MRFLFILLLCISNASAAERNRYETFLALAEKHEVEIKQEGMGYMVGGGLGLGLAVGLGISSKEALPKIGYSLIQVLSTAAIAFGASQYFYGDGFVMEAKALKDLAKNLEASGVAPEVRKKILNEATADSLRAELDRYGRLRKTRGYLELTSTAAAGSTLLFSKVKSSSSNAALGFIALISLIGGIADLTGSDKPDNFSDLYALSPVLGLNSYQLTVAFRW